MEDAVVKLQATISLVSGRNFIKPFKGEGDSYILLCPSEYVLLPGEVKTINMGFKLKPPPGYHAVISWLNTVDNAPFCLADGVLKVADQKNEVYLRVRNVSEMTRRLYGGTVIARLWFAPNVDVELRTYKPKKYYQTQTEEEE